MGSLIHSKKLLLILVIFVLSLTIRLYDLNATGGLWDEDIYFSSGYNFILNLKNRDFNPDKWGWNNEHPPLAKYIWGVGAYASYHLPDNPAYRPKLNYGIPKVYSAVLGSLTTVILMLIGWEFFSPLVGMSSSIFLSLQPQFIAYNKALDLSTPLIFFSTCSLYFFLKLLNKTSNRDLIMCFLFVGLSGATRYDGFLLIPIYFLISLIKDIKEGSYPKLSRKMFLTAPISLLVLFAIWPWIWREPIPRLISSLNFQGQHLGETNPLKILITFAVTQPLFVFVLFLLGLILSIKSKRSSFSQKAVVLWVFLFFLLSSIFRLGSNVRYFIPVFIPASLIAGLGFEYVYYKIRITKFRLAAALVILFYL